MKKLLEGIVNFRQHKLAEYREKFADLAKGQSPDALFIACCDSRVVPNVFASTDPGEVFVVRNMGNLVPPYHDHDLKGQPVELSVAAAIEYSVNTLKVSDIIICGHSQCAMCRYFIDGANIVHPSSIIEAWIEYAKPSYTRYQTTPPTNSNLPKADQLSQQNVLQQIDHLLSYPCVTEKIQNGELKLHGWWFDLATADVCHYDEQTNKFVIIDEQEVKRMSINLALK